MRTSIKNPVTLSYWNTLKNLGPNVKLELISLLASSMNSHAKKSAKHVSASQFYGAWKDSRPAEVLMKEIRDGREYENRELLPL